MQRFLRSLLILLLLADGSRAAAWAAEIGNGSVFSQTDSSNNTATDPGWPENMAPSRVNDAARALQGALKRDRDHRGPTVSSGGSANAQTLTYSVAPAAYYQGDIYSFIAGYTNTGAATLNVNSLGAKNIDLANAALTGGEIVAGQVYVVAYDGTQFQLVSPQGTQHGGLIGIQVFTSSGPYTPTAGTQSVLVELRGGGGGGGGINNTAGNMSAAGGAQGGRAIKRITSSFSGVTVTVGAGGTGGNTSGGNGGTGGTSSFGALVSASGGGGGIGATSVATRPAGNGGSGSGGDLNFIGQAGTSNMSGGWSGAGGGEGGGAGLSPAGNGQIAGHNGGGGGGASGNSSTGIVGGVGGDGWVIVYEYN